jgi:hypothetical protein
MPVLQDQGPTVGMDFYLAQNDTMPCDWVDAFKDKKPAALGLLWLPGQSPNICLKKWLKLPQQKILTVITGNGVCRRKGTCKGVDLMNAKDMAINSLIEVMEVVRLDSEGPLELRVVISLEDNLTYAEAKNICLSLKTITDAPIWRNPVKSGHHNFSDSCFDGVRLHNTEQFPKSYTGQCQWSNDGFDLDIPGKSRWELQHRISRAEMFTEVRRRAARGCDIYVWAALESNCLRGDTTEAPDPRDRNCASGDRNINIVNEFVEELQNGI